MRDHLPISPYCTEKFAFDWMVGLVKKKWLPIGDFRVAFRLKIYNTCKAKFLGCRPKTQRMTGIQGKESPPIYDILVLSFLFILHALGQLL